MWDIQRTFSAGELSRSVQGRTDLARVNSGLRTCNNFIVRKEGGVSYRPGTQYLGEVKDDSTNTRIIPFIYNDSQTYVLELGHLYMRVWKSGGRVTTSGVAAYVGATNYAKRALVTSGGITYYSLQAANVGHAPASSPLWWYPQTGATYEIPTTYASTELDDIKFAQSADVITLCHPSHEVAELSRYADTDWSLDDVVFDPVGLFSASGDYPSTVAYVQQRRYFASTNNDPEKVWGSELGLYSDFNVSAPVVKTDTIEFTLAGRPVVQVQHLVEVGGRLVILTSAGEWTVSGDGGTVVTPLSINAVAQSENGASKYAPVVINGTLVYAQKRGSVYRDSAYEFTSDAIKGRDLTVFASHLFQNYTFTRVAYQHTPDTQMWCVRSDGKLVCMTYLPDQDVWGWHLHETDGEVLDVCAIPEGNFDALYLLVERTGGTYVERVYPRMVSSDIYDSKHVDSGLEYNGTNTGATTITATGSTWLIDENETLTASAAQFVAGDVGNVYRLTISGVTIDWLVTAYTSTTVITARPQKNVPASHRAVATTAWARCVDEISGLSHLEGKTVSVLADGGVEGQEIVTSGAVTLSRPFGRLLIGLPYTGTVQTLDLEPPQQTALDKKKQIVELWLQVEHARGIFAGQDTDHLYEFAQRTTEDYGAAPELTTDTINVPISAAWNGSGTVYIQQSDPLPVTILSIAPQYRVGG